MDACLWAILWLGLLISGWMAGVMVGWRAKCVCRSGLASDLPFYQPVHDKTTDSFPNAAETLRPAPNATGRPELLQCPY